MKKLLLSLRRRFILCFTLLLLTPAILISQPPNQEEIQESIDLGVDWMADQQNLGENSLYYGSWGPFYYDDQGVQKVWESVAHTGFALTKLCDYAYEQGYTTPFDTDYIYYQNVIDGFNFLFSQAKTYGGIIGIYILEGDDPHHETYNTAIALMAIASCYPPDTPINFPSNPVLNTVPTFADLVNEIVAYFEWSQNDDDPLDDYYGSWGYHENYGWGDNSHTGYVVLALSYAEAYGAVIPQGIKDKLIFWINYIQNNNLADPDNLYGGSGYESPDNWVTSLKTGNLLFEMAFCGVDQEDVRVQDALGFLSAHWDDPSYGPDCSGGQPPAEYDYGWQEHLQAMYCLMKGFESYSIDFIEVNAIPRNWFEEFSAYIVGTQQNDGRWLRDNCTYWGWNDLLNTFWALFVLEKVTPPPTVQINFDIHPTSWPNPLNVIGGGVVPCAILGTETFDASTVDPTSLLLEGVAPLRWSWEDVTGPANGESECNDTEQGPDGYTDLTVKFRKIDIVAALGNVNHGDELILTITGNLIDGLAIEGNDCVVINGNKNTEVTLPDIPSDFSITQNYPNPLNTHTTITFGLPFETHVLVKVYDIKGNVVLTLTDQEYTAGYHSIEIDAASLSVGQYFYSLETKDHRDIKRMIIIR